MKACEGAGNQRQHRLQEQGGGRSAAQCAGQCCEGHGDPWKECMDTAVQLALRAGQVVRKALTEEKRVSTKTSVVDLVTETDHYVEELIISALREKFPSHRFIGEESTSAGSKCVLTESPTWIIDPIDGTCNFVHRFPLVAVSIGFAVNRELEFGVIYHCIDEKLYTARKGQGAFCNQERLHVTKETGQFKTFSRPSTVSNRQMPRGAQEVRGFIYGRREDKIALYADDILLFLEDSERSLCNAVALIEEFGWFSGLTINWDKSCMLLIEGDSMGSGERAITTKLKIVQKFKYLGIQIALPLATFEELNLSPLMQKIRTKIAAWNKLHLSVVGRVNLLKMIVMPQLLYVLHNSPIWITQCRFRKIRSLFGELIWGGKSPRFKQEILQRAKKKKKIDRCHEKKKN
ncbi:unnamed protein product [Ranitomeya imitator]|uniref:inositol-phosphate phosphatase n=1 Tax=Ranitomeya imitator TaxID=111125 RepID=A0ABN9KQX4_9NEOB|nr:unnamed protein product [Ranitomeya imitator]